MRIAEKAALSDVGRQRQGNEDSFLERSPLFAVADGMGGARAGEVASRLAMEAFEKQLKKADRPEEDIAEVARDANRRIHKMAQEDAALAGMGTTLVAAYVTGRDVAVGHVGDSRLYRLRNGELERLTQDHSLVEEFVRQGKLTPEEAEVHPQRSIITRALGPEAEVEVDTFTYPGRGGDVYLICSDGLTGMVSEGEVAEILNERESLEDAAEKLIAAANENGGKDNITVVMFRLESDGDDDEEPEDTLGGQATKVGVSAEAVKAAVAEATKADATKPHQIPEELEEEGKAEGRRQKAEGGVPVTSPLARRRRSVSAATVRRRRITGLLVLLALGAVVVGLYVGSRQFWFVGTDHGQVALYRGLPYDLPLGITLYSRQYVSSVPARAITNKRQRDHDLNQQLRSRGDAVDLVRTIERTYSPSR